MNAAGHLILSIDTSGADAGLALEGEGFVDCRLLPLGRTGQARTEDLASLLAAMLGTRGRRTKDISCIGAVVGPGSYTGIRSGLAFARGLAFVDSLPTVRVTALELLACRSFAAGEGGVTAISASQGRYAVGAYRRDGDALESMTAEILADDAEAAAWVETFEGRGKLRLFAGRQGTSSLLPAAEPGLESIASNCGFEIRAAARPSLEALAALVLLRFRSGQSLPARELLPVYAGQSSARPNRARVVLGEASE